MNALLGIHKTQKLADAPPETIKAVQIQLARVNLLDGAADGIVGKQTLAAFAKFKQLEYLEHPELLGKSTAIALLEATYTRTPPKDADSPIIAEHKAFLPKVGWVSASDRVVSGGHFSWGEFTKELTRVPQNTQVVDNIIRLANYLEDVRSRFGKASILINSGYRPPAVNRSVGGATNSQHLYGAAADIVVGGFRPHEVYQQLNQWHGDKGGLGNSASFTHIDLRGYRARWNYGNA
ncbi:D-Ala-D-Ala carboxypeptidase family metallohydrolase [Aliterella atlantica]|uniref:D-Ala-D-Ala carboxypeptidase family metallohydrolase n=1 Tax=Aliterella atlantica TaxID=1827278 RepID=UPI000696288C|nr:D-Ala-D-Ala carboxypeptidase family metallohydrolase [Aliterella atlantica]